MAVYDRCSATSSAVMHQLEGHPKTMICRVLCPLITEHLEDISTRTFYTTLLRFNVGIFKLSQFAYMVFWRILHRLFPFELLLMLSFLAWFTELPRSMTRSLSPFLLPGLESSSSCSLVHSLSLTSIHSAGFSLLGWLRPHICLGAPSVVVAYLVSSWFCDLQDYLCIRRTFSTRTWCDATASLHWPA
jgi:hypothetical protein